MRTPYIKISYFGFNFDWKSTCYLYYRKQFCQNWNEAQGAILHYLKVALLFWFKGKVKGNESLDSTPKLKQCFMFLTMSITNTRGYMPRIHH